MARVAVCRLVSWRLQAIGSGVVVSVEGRMELCQGPARGGKGIGTWSRGRERAVSAGVSGARWAEEFGVGGWPACGGAALGLTWRVSNEGMKRER